MLIVAEIQECCSQSQATIAQVMGDLSTQAMGDQEPASPPDEDTTSSPQMVTQSQVFIFARI